MKPQPLLGASRSELEQLLIGLGQPAFRGRQIAGWLYRQGARTFSQMTNLPGPLRERLAADFTVGRSSLAALQQGRDGTTKFLLEEVDGARIECVLIPDPDRATACISSQTGCAIGCSFCATGFMGAGRNLTAGEIVDQVLTIRERLLSPSSPSHLPPYLHPRATPVDSPAEAPQPSPSTPLPSPPPSLTHIVFMGMGEPLLNYDSVLTAIHRLHQEMGISQRRITLSTVGIVPKIRQLARERLSLTLAISLHAPEDHLRRRLIPTSAHRWNLRELLSAGQEYFRETGRRITFEYVLLEQVNDYPEQAAQLGRLLRGLHCHINLIPFNPVPGIPFHRPSRNRVRKFRQLLLEQGLKVTQRFERGLDIAAACGQLKTEKEKVWSRLALD